MARRQTVWLRAATALVIAALMTGCQRHEQPRTDPSSSATLRVGEALLSASNPAAGLQQLDQLFMVEGLGQFAVDGRVEPKLAEGWTLSPDRCSLVVKIRPGIKFHDGSPLDAATLAAVLPAALRTTLGGLIEDLDHVRALGATTVEIGFRRPAPLMVESLEVPIKKPGLQVIGTGPFMAAPNSMTDLRANLEYYAAKPAISAVRIETFPSVRTAWAELLRNNLDMLYEVGPDALDSLGRSTNVSVFTFTRPYQYAVIFSPDAPALRPPAVRRALSTAIDRSLLVRQALNQHGLPSSGPIWPKYWALQHGLPTFQFDPQQAASDLARKHLRFTLLIAPDEVYERIALELKRQFAAVGVDMDIRSAVVDEILTALRTRKYDAVLSEPMSGPSVVRLYQRWHTHGAANSGQGNRTTDAAFEAVRRAEDEPHYREGVSALHRAFMEDPPAIFLAWSVRARAISRRFVVTAPEQNRDVITTIGLWTPRNDERFANRN